MNCKKCGVPLTSTDQQFCGSCGAPTNSVSGSGMPSAPTYSYNYSSIESFPTYQNTNNLALVGFIMSLFCCGPLAIVLSAIGLSQIKSNPVRYKGRGLAIAGIIIGTLSTIIGILYYFWIGSVIFSEL